jgi:hypothetical protein
VQNDGEENRPASRPPERAEPEIKVTDRRMFTPSGELREEFRDLADAPPPQPAAARPAATAPPAGAAAPPRDRPAAPPAGGGPATAAPGAAPRPEPARPEPGQPAETGAPGAGGPGILDLVGMLVESAAVYLGDARLPDGGTAEDLDLARFHIDLLDVLRRKTAGNLTAQESAALDDVLYRLRVRYVHKRG